MKNTLETVYELLDIVEERKGSNLPLCNLLIGDPNIKPPNKLLQSLEKSVYDGTNGYSPAKGDPELINAILNYDQVCVDPSQIIIGNGSKTLVYIALKILLNAGDKVCIFKPYYPAYQSLLHEFKAQITYITHNDNYLSIIKKKQPKLVIVTTPNNPDGYTYSKTQLQEISDLVKEQNSILILDEAYRNFIYNQDMQSGLKSFVYQDHVIALRTFSKALAICGWRIGYAIASTSMIKKMAQTQLSLFNPLNRVMQRALTKYLNNPEPLYSENVKAIFYKRLQKVCAVFASYDIRIKVPMGAFYIFIELNLKDTQDLCLDLARKTGIILWPGFDFGQSSFIRISIAQLELDQIDLLVQELVVYLKAHNVKIIA